jgi:hypothetical protein
MRASCVFIPLTALSLLMIAFVPRPCQAAACCGNGHGLGQRLGLSERASATASVSLRERFGAYHAGGEYIASAEGNHDREMRCELGWLVKVGRRVQLGMIAPAVVTWRHLGQVSSSGGGMGDAVLTGRYDVIALENNGWVPPLAITLALTLPTGRSAHSSADPLLADATGLGVFEVRPGLSVERTWDASWFAAANLSVGIRSPFTEPGGSRVELAPRLQAMAMTGPVWSWGLSIAAGALYEWEAGPTLSGRTTPNTSRSRTAAAVLGAYDFSTHWTGTLSMQLDLPIRGFGRNDSTALEAGLGVRYVWGQYD